MTSKKTQRNILITIFVITVCFAVSFGLTIKYNYDEISHYQTDVCHLINRTCTRSSNEDGLALTSSNVKDTTSFSKDCNNATPCTGYNNITITYLYSSNETNYINYTKTDWTTDQVWSNYCFNYEKDILCYYDDRDVFDSLKLFNPYVTKDGIIMAIVFLFMGLLVTLFATFVSGCQYFCFQNPREINIEYSSEIDI